MLIDFFSFRYKDVVLWDDWDRDKSRFMFQAARLINEELFPLDYGDKTTMRDSTLTKCLKQHAMELGENDPAGTVGAPNIAVSTYLQASPLTFQNADEFIKDRVSLIELIFRSREMQINGQNLSLNQRLIDARAQDAQTQKYNKAMGLAVLGQPFEQSVQTANDQVNKSFSDRVEELNVRASRAGMRLTYHAQFFQMTGDKLIEERIKQPFWSLISDATWANVETDMLEALDTNDKNGRDPSLYASKALESTLKIFSDNRGCTRGTENGASQYAQSLRMKEYIDLWEEQAITDFFRKVRNPHGHGPGNEPMPLFNQSQNEWAIETCMSWIKSLVSRY